MITGGCGHNEMSEGEGANYAPDGSEQMVLFKGNGTYIVSLDGKSVEDPKEKAERMVSLRDVNKKMQTHKIEKKRKAAIAAARAARLHQSSKRKPAVANRRKKNISTKAKASDNEVRLTKKRIESGPATNL